MTTVDEHADPRVAEGNIGLSADDPSVVFRPAPSAAAAAQLSSFVRHVSSATGLAFDSYAAFEAWAVEQYPRFWRLFVDWSGVLVEGSPEPACRGDDVETARFFPDLRLNYVENLLRDDELDPGLPAVTACRAGEPALRLSRGELRDRVLAAAGGLQELGVGPGTRLAAVVANTLDAVVAALAGLSLGATFSSVAPDMGVTTVLQRFQQLEPAVLLTTISRRPSGGSVPLETRVAEIVRGLPSLTAVVTLDGGTSAGADAGTSEASPGPPVLDVDVAVHRLDVLEQRGRGRRDATAWPRLPFDHPLFILFSSGTTGAPKCLVHGAGGTLLEHLKEHRLHTDLGPGDRMFFQTSAAWMMWNWQLSALASGAEIVLYDGPVDAASTLWRLVAEQEVTVFGTSPPYLRLGQDTGFSPRTELHLDRLRAVLSTGSVLADEQYDWVAREVGPVPLQSISGGTDILGCFVLGNPLLPVHRGEAQCRSLGFDVRVADGVPDVNGRTVGELVCVNPFPSRPLGLLGDEDGSRFHRAYFAEHPGSWTHGDLLELTGTGGARIHGRSDSVLNIRGVRVGPAEIYTILDGFPEIRESLAVQQSVTEDEARLVLLVVTDEPGRLDTDLRRRIRRELASQGSAAHVPSVIAEVPDLPRTFSGKRSEAAVRHLLAGTDSGNREALANPDCLPVIAWQVRLEDARSATVRVPGPPAAPAAPASPDGEDERLGVVRGLMAAALELPEIGPDDNFFDLGGDSLHAVAMLLDLEERLGVDLPPSVLLEAPTPAALAAVVSGGRPVHDAASGPVDLRPGTGRPLFLVPGLGGDVLGLRPLARHLRTSRPVVGLRAQGLDGTSAPYRTVEEIARHQLEQVRRLQPEGPYALIGFSFGGLVAYEMARMLRADGVEVETLTLIDTHVQPRSRPGRAWWKFVWQVSDLYEIVRHPWQRVPRLVLQIASRRLSWVVVPPDLLDMPPSVERVAYEGDWPAYLDYRPEPYPDRLTFLRATERQAVYGHPVRDWRRLTGGRVRVRPVDGNHLSVLQEPAVARLAEELDRVVEEDGGQEQPHAGQRAA